MTSNDLERRNSPYFAFLRNSTDFQADYITVVEDRPNVRKILSPSSSLLLLAKTITHPAARSLCDSWASCSHSKYTTGSIHFLTHAARFITASSIFFSSLFNKKLRYDKELQHVLALFPALHTLALPRSPHAETRILHLTVFSQQHKPCGFFVIASDDRD